MSFLILTFFLSFSYPLRKEFEYLELKLGMSFADVTNIIEKSEKLRIDESRFFGKINEEVPFIIKATYFPFIESILIQFHNDKSYGITIIFNPGYFDFFTLAGKLQEKYGTPLLRTSKLILWEGSGSTNNGNTSDPVKLRLEYPSTVKVIDYNIMKQVNTELSQNIVKITNESIIQSNKRALLDEL